MSGPVPENFALYALLCGFGAALLVVVLGVVQLVREGLALRERLEKLRALPFLPTLELTQARVAIASRRAESVPALLERASLAQRRLDAARTSVGSSVDMAWATLRATFVRRR